MLQFNDNCQAQKKVRNFFRCADSRALETTLAGLEKLQLEGHGNRDSEDARSAKPSHGWWDARLAQLAAKYAVQMQHETSYQRMTMLAIAGPVVPGTCIFSTQDVFDGSRLLVLRATVSGAKRRTSS